MKYTISNPIVQKYVYHIKPPIFLLLMIVLASFITNIIIYAIATKMMNFRNVIIQENMRKIMLLSAFMVIVSAFIFLIVTCVEYNRAHYYSYSNDS